MKTIICEREQLCGGTSEPVRRSIVMGLTSVEPTTLEVKKIDYVYCRMQRQIVGCKDKCKIVKLYEIAS
jgi:hypothetical protein